MTINVPYRGIIEIVGSHDTGKTIATLQTAYPYDKTVFVDDDVKGDGTVRQMRANGVELEKYINLGQRRTNIGQTPSAGELLDKVVYPTIAEITSSHHEVIIWDTWRIVYTSARMFVEKNQSLFNNTVKWSGNSTMIQGLISKVARSIEQRQINLLRSACDLLIITHHLKDKYVQNVQVGETPESSATFSEVCNMRMWLRRNPESKVPIVLFLKRPSLPKVVDGVMQFVNLVPMKITPNASEQSVWNALHRYELDPIESRQPRADETPTADEYAAISNTLTLEQRQYVTEMAKYAKVEQAEQAEIVSGLNNTPENGVALLASCMKELNMDGVKVTENTGLQLADILSLSALDTARIWQELRDYGKSSPF
jgi:archaellum biogenesis ATPase FlaH